jgi:hypothetical protein
MTSFFSISAVLCCHWIPRGPQRFNRVPILPISRIPDRIPPTLTIRRRMSDVRIESRRGSARLGER